ncbi:hypothetical protein AB0O76_34660 [Streptomyces sp. NPDC086554]
MQFFALEGLATPIDDVWKTIGDRPEMHRRFDIRNEITSTTAMPTTA